MKKNNQVFKKEFLSSFIFFFIFYMDIINGVVLIFLSSHLQSILPNGGLFKLQDLWSLPQLCSSTTLLLSTLTPPQKQAVGTYYCFIIPKFP